MSLWLRGYALAARALARCTGHLEAARSGLEALGSALTDAERAALSLYAEGTQHSQGRLFDWEEDWFDQELPPAPARILVGGCGAGREVAALLDRGYEVAGCEPAPALYRKACEALGRRARLWPLSYQRWGSHSEGPSSCAPFDGILLGWTSFSHLLSVEERRQLLGLCHRWCPAGPWLLSYLRADQPEADEVGVRPTELARGRAAGIGRLLAHRVRSWRRLPVQVAPSHQTLLLPHAGFVSRISAFELRELAATYGRVASLSERGYPHATLRLPEQSRPAQPQSGAAPAL